MYDVHFSQLNSIQKSHHNDSTKSSNNTSTVGISVDQNLSPMKQVGYQLNQAVAKHKEGQIEAAIDLYLKSLELEKLLPDWVYENIIILLSQTGQISQRINLIEDALKIHADSDKIHRALGLAANEQGSFEKSINCYLKSLELSEKQPDWLYSSLIEMLVASNQLQKAVEIGNLAIKLHQDSVWINYHLAEAFAALENWQQALYYYHKSYQCQPDLPHIVDKINLATDKLKIESKILENRIPVNKQWDSLHSQAVAKHKEGKLEEAIALYLESLQLKGQQPAWVYENTITLLVQVGRFAEGLSLREQALKHHANSDEICRAIGLAFNQQGDLKNSIDYYLKSLNINQNQPDWLYASLIEMLVGNNQFQQAVEIGHKGIKFHQDSVWLNYHFAEALAASKIWEEALSYYIKADELEADLPNIQKKINLAVEGYLNKQNSLDKIVDTSNKIFHLYPECRIEIINVFFQKARAYAAKKKWENALIFYEKVTELQPHHPEVYHFWGDALLNLERWEESIELYRKSILLQPSFEWTHFNLGNALLKLEKWDLAIAAYQNALEINPGISKIYENLTYAFQQKAIAEGKTGLELFYRQLRKDQDQSYQQSDIARSQLELIKQSLDTLNKIALDNFLLTESTLDFPEVAKPRVSIILILYNRAELTLSCLFSILSNNFKSLELIIVDNCSTDQTRLLLQKIRGAKIILNEENLHFLLGCNQASKIAQGDYLLFLNNDAQILGASITSAVKTMESAPDIGAVGGKIILPDGSLQESGSIIWKNGSCLGYGRGDSPTAPEYMFQRSVDYCSGAFLLTKRNLFEELGGFDEDYKPAYYEETDYCVRLLKLGKKIIYNPDVTILHYEFASSSASEKAIELQRRNRAIFIEKHRDWLENQYPSDQKNLLWARTAKDQRQRILFLEDRVPHPYYGSGFPRSHHLLTIMVDLGYAVTLYLSDASYQEEWPDIYSDISKEIEVIIGDGLPKIEDFLQQRKGYYDIIFVSRPHNMAYLNHLLSDQNFISGTKLIYDAEALYCLRDFEQKRLQGEDLSPEEIAQSIENELNIAEKSDCIISVSVLEKQKFTEYGYENVEIMGHSLRSSPTPKGFSQRQNLLFVGAIHQMNTPNADSVIWLAEEIFPLIQTQLAQDINLLIAGTNKSEELKTIVQELTNPSIKMLGRVEDLTNLYNECRIFIAPTRFAAGISLKVLEAAAHGLPVITTSLIANQLGWQNESELLVADNAQQLADRCRQLYNSQTLWESLRINALHKIEQEYSSEYFSKTLQSILSSCKKKNQW